MQKLKLDLVNCYGIQKLKHEINFEKKNIAVLYAPNGTMKTSLAKTLEDIRVGREVEERVFGNTSSYTITDEKDIAILPESIIVINPFEEKSYDNQGLLMANAELRNKYLQIHKNIDSMKEELYVEAKNLLGFSNRSSFDVENTILNDWKFKKQDLFKCLEFIEKSISNPEMKCSLNVEDIDYNVLFNDKVYAMVTSGKTSELIEQYEEKYNEIVEKSPYMKKGIIDHNNYTNINEALDSNGFFEANNEIKLNAKDNTNSIIIKSKAELVDLMKKEKEKILNTKELKDLFEKINKVMKKNKDTQAFNLFLQQHPEIVAEYRDIEKFKKKIWVKIMTVLELKLKVLLSSYRDSLTDLKELRDAAKNETTDWYQALTLFKERFFVPFSIEPINQEDVILNLDMPVFKYTFTDQRGDKEVTKEGLLDVLSTGEMRAYYILNFIFQILVARKDGKEKLVLLDDISESFDYKNKHAIIEYISDISTYKNESGEKIFTVLLLTHNFDFYRTVASRIIPRSNAFIAYSDNGEIKFEKGHYTKNLFKHYKCEIINGRHDQYIVAAIPFVRNLIEYTEGEDVSDYLCLTSILHYKSNTKCITLGDIQNIFEKYWLKNNSEIGFADGRENALMYDIIIDEANKIEKIEKMEVENKIILSMAIRLKTEEFIVQKIIEDVDNGEEIINSIYQKCNQTAHLIKAYKKFFQSNFDILEQVAMITPENIHLNSFMFEPILDMSLLHLYDLYEKVKQMIFD